MKTITIYQIHEWDGGELQLYRGKALATPEAADRYRSVFKHDLVKERTILIFDSIEDMAANSQAKLRESGLAKLTDAEKKALGLKD